MKKFTVALTLVMALGGISMATQAVSDTGGMKSLRGAKALDEGTRAPTMHKFNKDEEPMKRSYVQQPPVIPHKVRGYKVDLNSNKCLSCHSWDNYKESGATKVSLTHFNTRDGHALADISPRRYFCMQCHVPQAVTEPLVENTYKNSAE
ncbi:MAG: nitrate reductase cytochrome c-type subunit [Motiliproteus sp.]|nr:nitrate reductase cytochrome c-type subunit [Motiliproteus sp.]MCW9051561.1 nitrate reductase cytochrome c-type subunit [Motiliproteus sp.]